jgi:hypothetical protein
MNTAPWSREAPAHGCTRWSYRAQYDGVRPVVHRPGYNGHDTLRPLDGVFAIHHDPVHESPLRESTNLRLVRLRLFLALITMSAIPIAIAAPGIYGLAWGFGTSLLVPTVALVTLTLVLGALTVWLARRVLEPAERLEKARLILEDADHARPRRCATT